MMGTVYVVFYDQIWESSEQRRIEGVYDSPEKARERVGKLNKDADVSYANFTEFEVQ